MSAQSKYYNTGGGELYFTPITDGVLGTESAFGETENVKFSSEIETLKHDNTESSVTFEDLNILKKITGKVTIESVEISPEMLQKAFLATDKSVNTAKATASLANVTIVALDTAYDIGTKYLSNVVVKDDTDTTTYTENTDYTVNLTTGYITALTGGAITASDVIHVTFDNDAYKDIQLEAFMNSKLEGKLRFVGKSANGISYTYIFHRVSMLASGDFSLKSAEELTKIAFEGTMLASEDTNIAEDESKLFQILGSEKT